MNIRRFIDRRADAAASTEEGPLRLDADEASVILWVTDAEGACTGVNRAWQDFTGLAAERALGQGWSECLHPEDVERSRAAAREACAARRELVLEYRLRRHDGEFRWMLVRSGPRFAPSGELRGYAGSAIDVTEHRTAESERLDLLLRAEQAKDEFLANLSHELRSPLNAILNWAGLLRDVGAGSGRLERGLEVIVRSARHQERLIEDLLDVARIVSGKLRFEAETLELGPILEAALEAVRPAADAKGVHLTSTLEPALAVSGDPDRLHQVIWNLLSNAVKFTPGGGRVDLQLERAGTYARIRVSDTGIGIEREFLPFVFDRFRQGRGRGREHGGLGLGLAIVRHLTELHGGSVAAESDGEGCGATFVVTLPSARP